MKVYRDTSRNTVRLSTAQGVAVAYLWAHKPEARKTLLVKGEGKGAWLGLVSRQLLDVRLA